MYVHHDILRAIDNQNIVIMMLLKRLATFDIVAHNDKVKYVHVNGYTSPA